ncbi:hypothetical protein MOBT1_003062 [Malassezia obtusa]|uniref:Uncharacterized protein n=1 Tax=Malassezia obtusa TaxID=76774 RepID=A0AAF0IT39_9BASI|nr:hypothetical protein MOBT1_003062 [Malassezia obtusa]
MHGVALAGWLLLLALAVLIRPSRAALERAASRVNVYPGRAPTAPSATHDPPDRHTPATSLTLSLEPLRLYTFLLTSIAYIPYDDHVPDHTPMRTWACFVGLFGTWWRATLLDTHQDLVRLPPLGAPCAAHHDAAQEHEHLRAQKRAHEQARASLRRDARLAAKAARAAENAAREAEAEVRAAQHAHDAAQNALHMHRAACADAEARLCTLHAESAARATAAASASAHLATSTRASVGRAEELREEIAALRRTAALLRAQRRPAAQLSAELDVAEACGLLPSNLLSGGDEEPYAAAPGVLRDMPGAPPPLATTPGSAVSRTPPTPSGVHDAPDYLNAGFRGMYAAPYTKAADGRLAPPSLLGPAGRAAVRLS